MKLIACLNAIFVFQFIKIAYCLSNYECSNQNLILEHIDANGLESCNRQFSIYCCLQTLLNLETLQIDDSSKSVKLSKKSKAISEASDRWQTVHPNFWNERFPNQCSKLEQSPINIETDETVHDRNLKDFKFKNFGLKVQWKMKFDGYSIEFVPVYKNSQRISVSGSNLGSSVFEIANFHFHWGRSIGRGSEHQINRRSDAAEVHLVMKANENGKTRYMVLGFLFTLRNIRNKNLDFIIGQMKKKLDIDEEFQVDKTIVSSAFALTKLLPNLREINREGYFRYNGSLTVPPCTEGITWNVFRKKIPISRNQAQVFNNENHISHRPVQPLNSRTVYRSARMP